MSAQDRTEQIFRDIYIMLSKCEIYDKMTNSIIVDKKELLMHLKNLNTSIYDIMEEYDMTQQSRDAAERAFRKKGNELVSDAKLKAEDVYAASVIYTDEALCRVQDIMQEAVDSVKGIYDKMNEQLLQEKKNVRNDQSELKGLLQSMADSDKYLKLIEERNRQIKKEKEKEKEGIESKASPYAAIKPEIKINAEYFEKAGIALEEEPKEEVPEEKKEPVSAQVNVNLDADYFKWKEETAGENEAVEKPAEKKTEKYSLFGKLRK